MSNQKNMLCFFLNASYGSYSVGEYPKNSKEPVYIKVSGIGWWNLRGGGGAFSHVEINRILSNKTYIIAMDHINLLSLG